MTKSQYIPAKPKKSLFKKKAKKQPKAKIEAFAQDFYAQYGQMMSRLSHE